VKNHLDPRHRLHLPRPPLVRLRCGTKATGGSDWTATASSARFVQSATARSARYIHSAAAASSGGDAVDGNGDVRLGFIGAGSMAEAMACGFALTSEP